MKEYLFDLLYGFPNFVNESEPTVDIWQEHKTLKFNLPCQRDMHYFTFQTQAAK